MESETGKYEFLIITLLIPVSFRVYYWVSAMTTSICRINRCEFGGKLRKMDSTCLPEATVFRVVSYQSQPFNFLFAPLLFGNIINKNIL